MLSRILLMTPTFYGIEHEILKDLEDSGYDVTWIENKSLVLDYHGTKSKLRFLRRLYFFFFRPHVRYLKRELRKIKSLRFDILFLINGHLACSFLFRKLKKQNPELFSILYLWDSFSKYNWSEELILFDKVYTFDFNDSVVHGLEYKPNFYLKYPEHRPADSKYDLFFVGRFSQERFRVVDYIVHKAKEFGINYYIKLYPSYKIFLHNNLIYYILKNSRIKSRWIAGYILNFEVIAQIITKDYLVMGYICHKRVRQMAAGSNVILDLPPKEQSGYTHRMVEALANGKKVITTNTFIKTEEFYNHEQIRIVDELNPEIDFLWVLERSVFPVNLNFRNQDLSKWLKSILNAEVA
jgi:hypothetical protein